MSSAKGLVHCALSNSPRANVCYANSIIQMIYWMQQKKATRRRICREDGLDGSLLSLLDSMDKLCQGSADELLSIMREKHPNVFPRGQQCDCLEFMERLFEHLEISRGFLTHFADSGIRVPFDRRFVTTGSASSPAEPSTRINSKGVAVAKRGEFTIVCFERADDARKIRTPVQLAEDKEFGRPVIVVSHKGGSVREGHYVTYVLHDENWYCIDDVHNSKSYRLEHDPTKHQDYDIVLAVLQK